MKKIDSMFPTDDSLSGHGLTLTKVYRSYKGSPHNVNATYLKYLVHRLENADKYKQATPDKQFKMDIDFLDHHQRGGAAVKNGRMRASDLEEFMKNPDTPKLAKQLLNHKKQLIDLIQKEHADHIVNINGEPHIRLTRGLNVTKKQRGVDHALASYADVPDPDFGEYMHHQLVPLKNVWFAYDYGPKAALEPTSLDRAYGSEDEFLVSPHKNIYSKDSKINSTKPIAYRKFHGLKINKKTISDYIDNYPEEAIKNKKFAHMLEPRHIDTIVQRNSYFAAQHLKDRLTPKHIDTIVDLHPTAAAHHLADRLNDKHIDTLVQNAPSTVAYSLSTLGHRLTNKHIDSIVQNEPDSAAYQLKDKLTSNHIQTIAEQEPKTAACYLYDHPLLNTNHIDAIVKNAPTEAAEYLHNHKLLNANHIQTIAENAPQAAAYYLHDHPIYQAKYGNKVQKSLQKSTKISKQLSNKVRQLLNSKAVLNKTRGTLKFPKILPKDTRPEENVKQIPKNEPEHQQYGGLFTVKPAEQQFIQAALAGAPSKEKHREAPQIRQQIHGGGLGGAYTLKTKQAFAFNPAFHVKAHEGLHSLVGKAAQKLQVKEDDVYNHLNSLIHPEDQAKLKATLSAYDYKPHTHPTEMIPRISDILHDKKIRSAFLNQHYPIDQDWSTFNPNTLTTEFHDPNVKAGWQAIQRLGRTWNAIVKMGKELEKLP